MPIEFNIKKKKKAREIIDLLSDLRNLTKQSDIKDKLHFYYKNKKSFEESIVNLLMEIIGCKKEDAEGFVDLSAELSKDKKSFKMPIDILAAHIFLLIDKEDTFHEDKILIISYFNQFELVTAFEKSGNKDIKNIFDQFLSNIDSFRELKPAQALGTMYDWLLQQLQTKTIKDYDEGKHYKKAIEKIVQQFERKVAMQANLDKTPDTDPTKELFGYIMLRKIQHRERNIKEENRIIKKEEEVLEFGENHKHFQMFTDKYKGLIEDRNEKLQEITSPSTNTGYNEIIESKLKALEESHEKVTRVHKIMENTAENIFTAKQTKKDELVEAIIQKFLLYFKECKQEKNGFKLHGSKRNDAMQTFFSDLNSKKGKNFNAEELVQKLQDLESELQKEDEGKIIRHGRRSELFKMTFNAVETLYKKDENIKGVKDLYKQASEFHKKFWFSTSALKQTVMGVFGMSMSAVS